MSDHVAATQTFRIGTQLVRQGEVFADTDPVVVGREHLFEPPGNTVRTTEAIGRPELRSPVPPAPAPVDGRPAGNASAADWARYVATLDPDLDVETLAQESRADLIGLADSYGG